MKLEKMIIDASNNPNNYWSEVAKSIHWDEPWDCVLDDDNPPFYKWFKNAKMNTCYNAVDLHVKNGRGDQVAIIYDSHMSGVKTSFTYLQLQEKVARLAGALVQLGVVKGDRVVIYMPMIPEALFAMLACARLGAIHSVVFGGFSGPELAKRIDDAKPKVILSASCGLEPNAVVQYVPLIEKALSLSKHQPDLSLILQRPQLIVDLPLGFKDWDKLVTEADLVPCVPVLATDPLYILYTSGTTGNPKGVLRDNGGHAVALKWSMENIYGCKPGDVFWTASDVGWVVGHSYICYAPLLFGCTTVIYEGKPVGTPDAGVFWQIISEYKVNAFFTAPTAIRAIRREDPDGELIKKYDLSSLHALFLAGEHCDPKTLAWCEDKLQIPIVDHWWQTETGWAIAANCLGIEKLPMKVSSAGKAVPGYTVDILDDNGNKVAANDMGNIAIKLPLPPGTLQTLWQNDDAFVKSYMSQYPGYYLTGDSGYKDEDDYLYIMGRIDDVINVAGHRLSTGAMEEVLSSHADIAECAVIGVQDQLKGNVPIGVVVLKSNSDIDHMQLKIELIDKMRHTIGPVCAFKDVIVVSKLPKTRSGKILRSTMRSIADGRSFNTPATIEDSTTIDITKEALDKLGYPKKLTL